MLLFMPTITAIYKGILEIRMIEYINILFVQLKCWYMHRMTLPIYSIIILGVILVLKHTTCQVNDCESFKSFHYFMYLFDNHFVVKVGRLITNHKYGEN